LILFLFAFFMFYISLINIFVAFYLSAREVPTSQP